MKNIKTEVEKPRQLALYSHMESDGWYMVREFKMLNYDEHYERLPEGQEREDSYDGFVRVSDPIAVTFKAIDNDEIIAKAVESLNEEERKAIQELNAKIAKIRERKSQLLALTHQPEPVNE